VMRCGLQKLRHGDRGRRHSRERHWKTRSRNCAVST
jgi:hypothetical protein